jgi:hypothetical protein
MNSLEKLVRLANKFDKYAAEVDSTMVTLMVRPIANAIIEKQAQGLLMKLVAPALQQVGGDAKLGGKITTTAKRVGKGWQITSCIVGSNIDTMTDKACIAGLSKAATILGASISGALQAEFNKKATLLEGDTITGHQVIDAREQTIGY